MKITITERIAQKKEIDVEFPFYYINDYSDDPSLIHKEYGMVMPDKRVYIQEYVSSDRVRMTLEVERYRDGDLSSLSSYFDAGSTHDQFFVLAKERMLSFVRENLG